MMSMGTKHQIIFEIEHDPFMEKVLEDGDEEDLPEMYQELAKHLIKEDPLRVEELIKEFSLLCKEKRIWTIDDKYFYIKFLRAVNWNVKNALILLDKYIQFHTQNPKYFKNPLPSMVKHVFQEQLHIVLPDRDQYGRRVIYSRPGHWNPSKISFADAFGLACMLGEMMSIEPKTQAAGVTAIANAEGFGFNHFRNVAIEDAKNGIKLVQECVPVWFRAIHVVNAPRMFHLIFNLIKPLLNDYVAKAITFHNDIDSLHKSVPAEILPFDLGGSAGEFDNTSCYQSICKLESYFQKLDTMNNKANKA